MCPGQKRFELYHRLKSFKFNQAFKRCRQTNVVAPFFRGQLRMLETLETTLYLIKTVLLIILCLRKKN